MRYTDWIKVNKGKSVRDYVEACKAEGGYIDLSDVVGTFDPQAVRVDAIWQMKTHSYYDKGKTYWITRPSAWVTDGAPGNAMWITITDCQYSVLNRRAADDDYREEGGYVAFSEPIFWLDVFEVLP